MAGQSRKRRPGLSPRTAAIWIQARRAPQNARRRFRSWIEFPSLWTTSVLAGVLALILTLLLFVVGPPPEVALQPIAGPGSTESSEPPAQEPPTAPSIELTMSRGQLPVWWDEQEQTLTHSEPLLPPAHSFLESSGWTPAVARPAIVDPERYIDRAIAAGADAVPLIDSSDLPPTEPQVAASVTTGVSVEKVWMNDAADELIEYALVVRNESQSAVEHVAVRDVVPDVNQVVDVRPSAAVSPEGELVWDLGTMEAGGEQRLLVSLLPPDEGQVETRSVVEVQTQFGTQTRVTAPLVPEPVIPTPEPALAQPDLAEPDVVLPAGLAADPEPVLPAAEEMPAEPEEPAAEPFPFAATTEPDPALPAEPVDAVPPGSQQEPPAAAEASPFDQTEQPLPRPEPLVDSIPAQPLLRVHSTSPEAVKLGDVVTTVYEVSNEGTAAAENVVLTVHLTDELLHRHGADVRHRIDRLEPGESIQARLRTRARETGTATLDARLTLAGDDADSETSSIRVNAADGSPPESASGAADTATQEPETPPAGQLR